MKVMNLTAITEYDEVMKKHFVDSISLCKAYDVTQNKNSHLMWEPVLDFRVLL